MSEVKRYDYGYKDNDCGGARYLGLIEKPDGALVRHSDYACLEQEYAELVERYGKLQTGEGHITHRVIAERDAALKLLARCQEKLDPHRDAVLWGEVCDALTTKP